MKRLLPCLLVLLVAPVWAVDLIQLAAPSALTLTLYPGQTRAMVREVRQVNLPVGDNTISFSWTAAGVDAEGASLTLAGAAVGNAVRATGQDRALLWHVNCPQAVRGEAAITYFVDGCKWSSSYGLWLQPDGRTARLVGFLHLDNETGVDLRQAQVQVAVAGAGIIDRVGGDDAAATTPGVATVHALAGPLNLDNGETTVRPLLEIDQVPATVHYLYQADRFNGAVERLLALDLPVGLAGLPEGTLTVFGAADDDVPLFDTQLSYQPGQELKLDLGPEPDVVVERKLMNTARSNFETDRFGRFTGSDMTEDYLLEVRNHLGDPITVEITEMVLSTWALKSSLQPDKTDTSSAEFDLRVPPEQPVQLTFTLVKHSGSRIKPPPLTP
jgi:hypothetical protein